MRLGLFVAVFRAIVMFDGVVVVDEWNVVVPHVSRTLELGYSTTVLLLLLGRDVFHHKNDPLVRAHWEQQGRRV